MKKAVVPRRKRPGTLSAWEGLGIINYFFFRRRVTVKHNLAHFPFLPFLNFKFFFIHNSRNSNGHKQMIRNFPQCAQEEKTRSERKKSPLCVSGFPVLLPSFLNFKGFFFQIHTCRNRMFQIFEGNILVKEKKIHGVECFLQNIT